MTATGVFLEQLRDGGNLVNLSSVAGRTARSRNAVDAAMKWGINGWSESPSQELQPDIRVMVIEPGAVATELTDHITYTDARQAPQQMCKPRGPSGRALRRFPTGLAGKSIAIGTPAKASRPSQPPTSPPNR